jgi:hypothetical protein
MMTDAGKCMMSLIVELEYKLFKLSIMGTLSYLLSSLSWTALLLAVRGAEMKNCIATGITVTPSLLCCRTSAFAVQD